MSLQKKTLAAGRWQILNVIIFAVMNIAYLMIMARLVDKQYHGIFALLQIMVVILSMVSKNGLYSALVRREENTFEQVSFSFWGSLFLGSIFTFVVYVLADTISAFYDHVFPSGLVRLFSFYFIFYALGLTSLGLMIRDMDFKSIFISQCGSFFIGSLGVGVTMALFDMQLWALVYGFITFVLLNSIMNFIRRPHSLKLSFSMEEFHEVKHFSLGMTITEVLNSIAVYIDKLIIGKFTNMTTLAIFDKGQQTSRLPVKVFGSAFDVILYSVFSKLQKDRSSETKAFLRLSSLLWIVVVVLSLILYFYSHHIVVILLGAKWMEAIPILKIFAISMPALMIVKVSDSLFRAADKVYLTSRLKGIYVITIITSALLAFNSTLVEVSLYISGSYLFHLLLVIIYSCKMLKVSLRGYVIVITPAILIAVVSIVLHLILISFVSEYVGRLVMILIAISCQLLLMGFLIRINIGFLGIENVNFIKSVIPSAIKKRLKYFPLFRDKIS